MKNLVIYHANCNDGFAAAWCAWMVFGDKDAEYMSAQYGDEPPTPEEVKDRHVYILDFSYKADQIKEIGKHALSVTILDHHKTARVELQEFIFDFPHFLEGDELIGIRARFCEFKSGAGLAWEHFHPTVKMPNLILYVQDRDLWRFEFNQTKAVHAFLLSRPKDFDKWSYIAYLLEKGNKDTHDILETGQRIAETITRDIKRHANDNSYHAIIAGYVVPIINCPGSWFSEIGEMLSFGEPFAACYYFNGKKVIVGLRSSKESGIDVEEVAKKFGGGGHKHAAGFTVGFGSSLLTPAYKNGTDAYSEIG